MRFSFFYLSYTWDSLTAKSIQKFGKNNLTKLVNIIIMYNKSYRTKLLSISHGNHAKISCALSLKQTRDSKGIEIQNRKEKISCSTKSSVPWKRNQLVPGKRKQHHIIAAVSPKINCHTNIILSRSNK